MSTQPSLQSRFIAWYYEDFVRTSLFSMMDGLQENSPYHHEHSVGAHTNMVVAEYLSRTSDWYHHHLLGALACVFHDVGKPSACEHRYTEERGDYKSFPGHELISARLWEQYALTHFDYFHDLFGLTKNDIYSVGWMIEYHLPWGIQKVDKLNKLYQTANSTVSLSVFFDVLCSDAYGRISSNSDEKRSKVSNWLSEFEQMQFSCETCPEPLTQRLKKDGQPLLLVPIGCSGSGKTSLYREKYSDYHLYSWDQLRHEWYDSDDYAEAFRKSCADNNFVQKTHTVFSQLVKLGGSIYVDNANISAKRRKFFVTQARQCGYYVVAVVFQNTLSDLCERQLTRSDKTVPEGVVEQQYMSTQLPMLGEFDKILIAE